MKFYIISAALLMVATAQQYTTPVPILKQINKHNEDGSYSYGYEAADGSFKIESKYPNGEVYGKYGYIDDQGKLREIEYGASRRGFEPQGSEVNVAPPTLNNNNYAPAGPLGPNEEDDGQYREDPSVYYKNDPYSNGNDSPKSIYTSQPSTSSFNSRFTQNSYQQPAYKTPQSLYKQSSYQAPQQTYQPQQQSYQPQQQSYQPQQQSYQPQQQSYQSQHRFGSSLNSQPSYNSAPPAYPNYNQFNGHPATNVDIFSGSYSVQYKR